MGLESDSNVTFYRNKGCDRCSFTGYKGRVGVYEVLRMSGEMRRFIIQGASAEAITEAARAGGMRTLKDYSVWLLQNGWTTLDEVLQVVSVQD
jgi:type IV pilus assembly protein PilB